MWTLFPEIYEKEREEKEKEYESLKQKASKYSEDESIFQEAQEHWEKHGDLKSWNVMYIKIQKACFNCLNQKLCGIIPNEKIEGYSHDVTLNILNGINKKKARGEFWKIARLSAFVYLPCKAIYQKQKEFEDRILDESAYTLFGEDGEKIKETESSYIDDNGIVHL